MFGSTAQLFSRAKGHALDWYPMTKVHKCGSAQAKHDFSRQIGGDRTEQKSKLISKVQGNLNEKQTKTPQSD